MNFGIIIGIFTLTKNPPIMKKVYYLFVVILCLGCATNKDITKSSLEEIARIEDGWYKGYQNCTQVLPNSNANGNFVWVKVENEDVVFVGRNKADSKSLESSNFLVNNNLVVTPKTYSKTSNDKTKFFVRYEYAPVVFTERGGYNNNGSGMNLKCEISLYQ